MAIRTFGLANQNRRLYTHSPRNPAESPLPVESNCLGDGGDHPKSVVGRRSLGKSPIDFQVRRSRFPKWPDRIVCLQACMVPIYLIRISKYVVGAIFKMLCWSCRPNSTCSISLSLSYALVPAFNSFFGVMLPDFFQVWYPSKGTTHQPCQAQCQSIGGRHRFFNQYFDSFWIGAPGCKFAASIFLPAKPKLLSIDLKYWFPGFGFDSSPTLQFLADLSNFLQAPLRFADAKIRDVVTRAHAEKRAAAELVVPRWLKCVMCSENQ